MRKPTAPKRPPTKVLGSKTITNGKITYSDMASFAAKHKGFIEDVEVTLTSSYYSSLLLQLHESLRSDSYAEKFKNYKEKLEAYKVALHEYNVWKLNKDREAAEEVLRKTEEQLMRLGVEVG